MADRKCPQKADQGPVSVAVFGHDHEPYRSPDNVFAPASSLAPSFELVETRNETRTETDHQPHEQKRLVGWLHVTLRACEAEHIRRDQWTTCHHEKSRAPYRATERAHPAQRG